MPPNGVQEGDDPDLVGCTIELLYPGSDPLTTTTDSEGDYSFDGLTPGQTYTVQVVLPPGWVPTTATSYVVTPTPGQDAGTYDFGSFYNMY